MHLNAARAMAKCFRNMLVAMLPWQLKWEETRMIDTYSDDANDVCMREHENLVCVTTIERHMHRPCDGW